MGRVMSETFLRSLQRLPKRLLRLVVLVPVPLVKRMRALTNYIRSHRHPLTFFRPRPSFRSFKQTRTSPATPCRCADDEPVDFGPQWNLEQIRHAHMNPSNDFAAIV